MQAGNLKGGSKHAYPLFPVIGEDLLSSNLLERWWTLLDGNAGCKTNESTKNMLLDVLKRDVTPLRIVICATYRGHLARVVVLHITCYVFGKAE